MPSRRAPPSSRRRRWPVWAAACLALSAAIGFSPAADEVRPAGTGETAAPDGGSAAPEAEKARLEQAIRDAEIVRGADHAIQDSLPHPLARMLGQEVFGLPLWRYLAGAALLAAAFGAVVLTGGRLRKKLREIEGGLAATPWQRLLDILILAVRNPVKIVILSLALRCLSALAVSSFHSGAVWLSDLLLSLAAAVYFYDLASLADQAYGSRIFRGDDRMLATVRPICLKLIRTAIVLIAGMQIYQGVTGQTMLSLLAGLGIGGLALALASQETLKNLLGFASIALDKAFLVGDSVIIAGFEGTVEHVGLRSLRLVAGDGASIIIPNATAINSSIVNKSRQARVRRETRLFLAAANPFPKVEKALEELRGILERAGGRAPGCAPEVRLAAFEPGRLALQAVLWFAADYPDIQAETDRLNLEIGRRLADLGLILA